MQTQAVPATTAKVIAVDDELNILKSLKRLLRKLDCELEYFTDPKEALCYLEENKSIDLIISDMRMPTMSGADFLEASLKLTPGATRVLLTGYSDMESTKKAINDGRIFSFVSKPWDDSNLKSLVERILTVRRNAKQKISAKKNLEKENQSLEGKNNSLHKELECKSQEMEEALSFVESSYLNLQKNHQNLQQTIFSIFQMANETQQLQANEMQDMILDLSKQYNIQIDPRNLELIVQFYIFLEHLTTQNEEYRNNKELHLHLAKKLSFASNFFDSTNNGLDISEIFKKLAQLYENDLYLQEDSEVAILANIIQVVSYYIKNKKDKNTDDPLKKIKRLSGTIFDSEITNQMETFCTQPKTPEKTKVKEVVLAKIKPGSVLFQDLRSKHGFLLIAKGHQLSEQTIERLLNSPKLIDRNDPIAIYDTRFEKGEDSPDTF